MVTVSYEISKEEYDKAKEKGIPSILGEHILCGYGYYGGEVKEVDGKYWITYKRGDTCD